MKIRKGLILLFVFIGSVLFFREGLPQDSRAKKAGKSLIRRDLLIKGEKKLAPPLRNIFSPLSSSRAQIGTALVEEKRNEKPIEEPQDQKKEKKEPAPPPSALKVRYIGYVRSEGKIVALILFRGVAFAVEEGELLEEQLTVKEVTNEEIILTLGGFKPLKFAIEGESL